jgi:hypothetical protein
LTPAEGRRDKELDQMTPTPTGARRFNRRIVAALACAVTLTSFAAACGSSPKPGNGVASLGTSAPKATSDDTTDTQPDSSADTPSGSNGPTDSTDSTATDDSIDPEDAFVEYSQCMRENGFDMPDPQPIAVDENGVATAGAPVIGKHEPGDDDGPSAVMVGPGGQIAFDPSDPDYVSADEQCHSILDEAMTSISVDPAVEAEQRAQMLDFAKCMRDHGIDFPDPKFSESGGGVSIQIGDPANPSADAIDPSSEEFQAASKECGDLFGGGIMIGAAGPAGPEGDN